MTKRFLAAVLLLTLLTSCAPAPMPQRDRPLIAATVFPLYDFARAIAGDLCTVVMLLSPGSEPHGYDPTLQDVRTVHDSDLVLCVGGESDEWVQALIAEQDQTLLCAMDLVDLLPLDEAADDHDHHGHDHDEWDEHVWTSPRNAKQIASAIGDALCDLDPANVPVYRRNMQTYLHQLDDLDAAFTDLTQNAPVHTLLFADRFPFAYLAHDYDLTCYRALSGCSAVTEPGLPAIAELVRVLRDEHLPAVLYLEFSSPRTANTVAAATGAQVCQIHSCHNVTPAQFASGETYLTLMTQNLAVLEQALYP